MDRRKGLSQQQFARLDGCVPKTVRDRIKTGHLKPYPDGSLDPALVGKNWRKRTGNGRPKIDSGEVLADADGSADFVAVGVTEHDDAPDESTTANAKRLFLSDGFEMLETAEAERKKQNYLALLQELRYDRESGKVVLIEDITQEIADKLALVRAHMLAIPSKIASKIIGITDQQQARNLVRDEIERALANVAIDKQI